MGARRSATLYLQVNKKDGFDCQSCAWPSPDGKRHIAEFCENGAKAIASEGTRERATRELFASHTIGDLADHSDMWLNEQGRLTEPLIRRSGSDHYEPISWDAAFALIAEELGRLDSPDEASFYTSGRTSNEAAFLYQLFVRQFGTNNLPDCSNMCHESSGAAMVESIGVGKSTVVFTDFDETDTIFIIGQNPGTNHPRMLTALERAKRNGATIVSINPMPETGLLKVRNPNPQEAASRLGYPAELLGPGTSLTDLYLQVRVNGDVALMKGIMKAVLEEEDRRPGQVVDQAFIDRYTDRFDAFAADLRGHGLGRDRRGQRRRPRPDQGCGQDRGGRRAHDRVLGDGADPAPQRRRQRPGSHQPPAPRRPRRTAGCRSLLRPWALQRAGRPNDGHLGTR